MKFYPDQKMGGGGQKRFDSDGRKMFPTLKRRGGGG